VTRAQFAVALAGLLSAACAGAQTSPSCGDKAYAALVAECVSAATRCRASGDSEVERGTVCDAKADDWAQRCGK
jgi:hypothetical protein